VLYPPRFKRMRNVFSLGPTPRVPWTRGLCARAVRRRVSARTAAASATAAPLAPDAALSEARRAYPFSSIEKKWQKLWEEEQTFRTPKEVDLSKPKYYVLDMFPYPRYVNLQAPQCSLLDEFQCDMLQCDCSWRASATSA
jgi:hypothetical protein